MLLYEIPARHKLFICEASSVLFLHNPLKQAVILKLANFLAGEQDLLNEMCLWNSPLKPTVLEFFAGETIVSFDNNWRGTSQVENESVTKIQINLEIS